MSEEYCLACQGTHRNSKGGLCAPCHTDGGEPLKEVVQDAIDAAFNTLGRGDSADLVLDAVRWALEEPRITYAAGYRDNGANSMGMFAGPYPDIDLVLAKHPDPEDGRKAFIVQITRMKFSDEPTMTPVARWKGMRWQMKPTK